MMLVFPQIGSGAMAQFPIRSELSFRTVLNELPDGSERRAGDVDYERRSWELRLELLKEPEWQAIESFFDEAEGRLMNFVFLEPGANLLAWTEGLNQPPWENINGVTLTEGLEDPLGGTGAVSLSGTSGGALRQSLAIPGSFRYAASVWARTSTVGAQLKLSDGATGEIAIPIPASGQWKRLSFSWNLGTGSEQMEFSLQAPTGGSIEFFGPQLEAQSHPSKYKRTESRSGVYPDARFDQDELTQWVTGVDSHTGVVRIAWTRSQI